MKASAKAQHQVDKAQFEAAKAEAKASVDANGVRELFVDASAVL